MSGDRRHKIYYRRFDASRIALEPPTLQEAWIRLARSEAGSIDNLRAWLTTVVARVSLDMLRSRATRREDAADTAAEDARADRSWDPTLEAEVADSVGTALFVVLDRLTPSERIAFVLHDTFGVPFDELGAILGRSSAAAKQLASRARNKVRGIAPEGEVDSIRQRRVVEAFLHAARGGDLAGLVALLDPDIVLDADAAAVKMGAPASTRGAAGVAGMFSGRALGAELAIVDGAIGMAWIVRGATRVAWNFYIDDDIVVHIDMHADRAALDALHVLPGG